MIGNCREGKVIVVGLIGLVAMGAACGDILSNANFESGVVDWQGRSCTIAPESSPVHGGIGAVLVSNRSQNWHALRQDVTSQVQANGAGAQYVVSAWVRMMTVGSHTVKLRLRTDSTNYDNVSFTANDTGWTLVSFTTPEISLSGGESVWVEVANQTVNAAYYVDDCSLVLDGVFEPLVFRADPLVEATAAVGQAYRATLADDLEGGDGGAVVFERVDGPAWLAVAADGSLSGTPSLGALGRNVVSVKLVDGLVDLDTAEIEIQVVQPGSLPFRESFEDLLAWETMESRDAWSNPEEQAPETRPMSSSYGAGFPLAGVEHLQVMDMEGRGGLRVVGQLVHPEVVMEMMLQPSLRTDPTPPEIDVLSKTGFYFNGQGYLVVHHALHSGGFTSSERRWSVLSHTPVVNGQWVRIRVIADDAGDALRGDHYFNVELDGVALTGAEGYLTPSPLDELGDLGGAFFLCANHDQGGTDGIQGLEMQGRMRVDDLSMTAPSSQTAKGTSHEWIERYYPGGDPVALDLLDTDGDGFATWEEYYAGTDPTDPGSMLRLSVAPQPGGGALLEWPSPFEGALTPYRIERSADLAPGSWVTVVPLLERDPSGTTTWSDTAPLEGPTAFYRLLLGF